MHVVLISPYELGRQPFGLAQPAAWLREAGFAVDCLDLSLERLDPALLGRAELVGVYVAMHTATRIAVEALPRIRALAPHAHLCAYGLYAPMNEGLLHGLGVGTVLGGEFEPGLLALARRLGAGHDGPQSEPVINRSKIGFVVPHRAGLPPLERYAHLRLPGGETRTVGFAEASRGCKHLCRHCPVVPVYQGKFRIVPADVVLADIRNQVTAGAQHISFGDPDFLNGPTHALRVVQALHREFPHLTYDATIKVEHLVRSEHLLPALKETGCLFITSAVESIDEQVLEYLDKNHSDDDFERAVQMLRAVGIALAPTFLPFTPWTTLEGYVALLQRLVELRLVQSVPPVQLAIRLLVPEGSYLLRLPGFADLIDDYDPRLLGYPWRHPEARVDALQATVQGLVEQAEVAEWERRTIFTRIWEIAHGALDRRPPPLPGELGEPIPHMSEPWYCCAEPTHQQLQSF
jgi:radical SAM superfamily enzyme YgiQ (UPF0313 family)